MTCIVGIKKGDKIFMGADSLGSNSVSKTVRVDQKIFLNKGMLFGFTSSFRMGQILQYSFTPPDVVEGMNDMQYLVNKFIPSLIECYGKHSWLKKKEDVVAGGVFLLGFNGGLYKIESDFQVGINAENYNACGCGENYALGSLFTTETLNITPEERINSAIAAASLYSTGVGGPTHILSIG